MKGGIYESLGNGMGVDGDRRLQSGAGTARQGLVDRGSTQTMSNVPLESKAFENPTHREDKADDEKVDTKHELVVGHSEQLWVMSARRQEGKVRVWENRQYMYFDSHFCPGAERLADPIRNDSTGETRNYAMPEETERAV